MNRYWKRVGRVEIQGNDGRMHYYGGNDGLDFKFSGEKIGDIYTEFSVSILGLTQGTINELTVWDPSIAYKVARKIKVYAGYEGGGINSPIFEGIVIEAIPTNPPEMWLNIKCNRFGGANGATIDSENYGKTFELISETDALSMFANDLGCDFRWECKTTAKRFLKIDYQSPPQAMIRKVADILGVVCYENHGIIIARDKHPQLGTPDNQIEIDTEHGMLALGKISLVGANIKMRLDDRCELMSWINLKSTVIPKANGNYVVIRKKHTGHFRGEEWFTELETIRKGAKA